MSREHIQKGAFRASRLLGGRLFLINSGRHAEFKTRGTRSQIPENLGHVPEFGARLQIQDLEIQRNS